MDPLAALIPWLAAGGVCGLALATLVERLLPVLPSYALLVTVGIATAQGHWSLAGAWTIAIAGSLAGALPFYVAGRLLSEERALAVLERAARVFGFGGGRFHGWVARLRADRLRFAFAAQLVPTVRLFAPGIAGLLRMRVRAFLGAAGLGIALWNTLFIGAGYLAASYVADSGTTVVALATLTVLLTAEVLIVVVFRWGRRQVRGPDRQEGAAVAQVPRT